MIRTSLLLLTVLVLTGCVAAAPRGSEVPVPVEAPESVNPDLAAAWEDYLAGEPDIALIGFDSVIEQDHLPGAVRRQAWLGVALVYLTGDPENINPELAQAAMSHVRVLAPDGGEAMDAADLQAGMLAASVESLLATTERAAEVDAELGTARRVAAGLRAERDALRDEQQELSEALRELTEISLQN